MMFTQKQVEKAIKESNKNMQIQMLLYRWRDRGCPYDIQMVEMIYEIMEIARAK